MRERKPDRDFTYVQLRMPNEQHQQLTEIAIDDNRTIHGELLEIAAMWVKMPKHRRLALLAEAQAPRT